MPSDFFVGGSSSSSSSCILLEGEHGTAPNTPSPHSAVGKDCHNNNDFSDFTVVDSRKKKRKKGKCDDPKNAPEPTVRKQVSWPEKATVSSSTSEVEVATLSQSGAGCAAKGVGKGRSVVPPKTK